MNVVVKWVYNSRHMTTTETQYETNISLRHALATLGYRAAKVLRNTPSGFLDFRPGAGSRIEAARRIRRLSPDSKIIFLSLDNSPDVVQAALSTGALGYVYKSESRSELIAAVEAVLQGKQFVSGILETRDLTREQVTAITSVRFEFDSENQIVRVNFHGRVNDESIKEFYRSATALANATDFRASIVDFSGTSAFHVTWDAVRELAALPPIDSTVSRPRVIVAPSILIFGFARLFQVIGKSTRPNLRVVRNLHQAFALLGVTTPNFQPITPKS
jgi:CheY-like chemotaxis protein